MKMGAGRGLDIERPRMNATYTIASPVPGSGAAIAIVEISGDERGVSEALARIGVRPVALGRCGLREVAGVDTMVIARPRDGVALLFAHAGSAVRSRVTSALQRAGVGAGAREIDGDDRSRLPSRLHEALARAASPLAIDLLLEQPRRWERAWAGEPASCELPTESSGMLRRLIDPPVVVAIGPPNIGKSSLLNALAGRAVSVVADEPGTTRDHVGVSVDFAGLVVRFIDAPGITAPSSSPTADLVSEQIQRESQRIALDVADAADLILWCGDRASGFLPSGAGNGGIGPIADRPPPPRGLRVGLRSDMGRPSEPADVAVSARTGEGLEALVAAVREALVPAALLTDKRAWRFWQPKGQST